MHSWPDDTEVRLCFSLECLPKGYITQLCQSTDLVDSSEGEPAACYVMHGTCPMVLFRLTSRCCIVPQLTATVRLPLYGFSMHTYVHKEVFW